MLKPINSFLAISTIVCLLYYTTKTTLNYIESNEFKRVPPITIMPNTKMHKVLEVVDAIDQDDGTIMPIEKFLDLLICGACANRCPLLAPRCGTGEKAAARQTGYYDEAVKIIEADNQQANLYENDNFMFSL